uniref:Uncharacterized protein n=1 Tax=Anguilla anguilla TaxID=7936 RepID=A0A0E9SSD5_ANGAN
MPWMYKEGLHEITTQKRQWRRLMEAQMRQTDRGV